MSADPQHFGNSDAAKAQAHPDEESSDPARAAAAGKRPAKGGSKLLKAGAVTAAATFLSRILGMVRDMVIASVLGASAASDVFFFANRIPNFFRRLFAEGAFSQAFVPVMTKTKEAGGSDELKELISRSAGTLGTVVLVITVLCMLLSPVLTAAFGWGWFQEYLQGGEHAEKFPQATLLLRITFPYLLFITLTALSSAVLNVFGRFGIPAVTPCILNLTLIAAVYLCADRFADPNVVLAYGMVAGGVLQLLFQLPFIFKLKLLVWPRWGWHHPGVTRIRELMLPAILGVSASQLNLFINTLLATFLSTGAISYLYYSDRLLEFPIGIFAVAISTVILPALARVKHQEDDEAYRRTLDWGVRLVLLLGIPSMCGMIALREPILRVIFMRGAFSPEHVQLSAASLLASVSGLCAIMLVRVLVQGFAARQDTRTPVRCSLCAIAANIILNLILIAPLGYIGLALSTALAAYVNSGLLLYFLKRDGIYRPSKDTISFTLKALLGGAAMAAALRFMCPDFEAWVDMSTLHSVLELILWVGAGALIYFALLLGLGVRMSTFRR